MYKDFLGFPINFIIENEKQYIILVRALRDFYELHGKESEYYEEAKELHNALYDTLFPGIAELMKAIK